ncbi:transcription elongation factor B polypeptide 3 isoform X2 [Microplitis mediator]|uniref:transcription elongation factor B polypeptide 3 isoform X2 n=1 Tax=Microplitis mediator TaxID=375433 RepID=UPI002554AD69|nr:transcription elongation factor B polypeptide 3 isoform X2 [Microplitis mediator]
MSEIPVVNQIQHYQRSIEKYPDDEPRVLRCIRKLHDLPVTVQHLQETGVGRTVNALRKYDGTVGDAAKALVAKWKIMVVDEERSDDDDDDDNCVPDVSGGYTDNSDSGVDKDESHTRTSSSHKLSELHERGSNSRHESRSSKHSSNNSSDLSRSKSNKSNTDNNDRRRHHSKSSSSSSSSSSINNNDKLEDTNTRHEIHEKKSKSHRESSSKSDRHSSRKDDNNIINNSSNKTVRKDKDKESLKVSSHEYSKHNGHSSSDRKRKRDSSANEKHVDKRRRSSTVDESDDDDDKSGTDTNEISDNECDKIKINIKSESPESPPRVSKSKETGCVKKEKSKDKTGDRDDKHKHSSSSSKHKVKSDSSKSSEHRRQEKKKDEVRESSSSACKSRGRSTSSSKDTDKNKHSEKIKEKKSPDSKDKDKDKSKDKDKKHKEKKSKKFNGHEGIDCNSGASFAEALGMCTASTSFSRKKVPTSPIISIKSNKPEAGTSAQKTDKIKTESSSPKDEEILYLLSPKIKLKPLNVDLASTLPEISANYKPLPVNHMNPIYRRMEEDKALNDAIYAKNIRTKVYSGNKTSYTSVPSLYELCIRVLIENIEALECTGGVPYYLLKPVLDRATADQLYMIEHYNPYLIEDTDTLWKFHCNREFRNREREEMESWREMYMRCLDEREAKLKTLTANIKQSIDKSVPARSTIMAYVDDVVKPPRNVLRKQARYGTSSATSSSDIKKKIILTGGTNAATTVSVPAPPMSRVKSSNEAVMSYPAYGMKTFFW